MNFEFDTHKSDVNKKKHGIDFIKAQALWNDEAKIIFPAKSEDEPRFALIAVYKSKLWVAFYTLRGSKVRLISVRRARDAEKELYES